MILYWMVEIIPQILSDVYFMKEIYFLMLYPDI
jgi:hypothetical protein